MSGLGLRFKLIFLNLGISILQKEVSEHEKVSEHVAIKYKKVSLHVAIKYKKVSLHVLI